jgi:hypothetical protein
LEFVKRLFCSEETLSPVSSEAGSDAELTIYGVANDPNIKMSISESDLFLHIPPELYTYICAGEEEEDDNLFNKLTPTIKVLSTSPTSWLVDTLRHKVPGYETALARAGRARRAGHRRY